MSQTLLELTGLSFGGALLSGIFNALGLTNNNQPQQSQGTIDAQQHLADLFNLIFPSTRQEVQAYQQRLPQRMSALDAAYNALSPMNQMAQAEAYGNRARDVANRSATSYISSNPGLSSGAQEGLRLDAQNRGQSAANSFYSHLYDPTYQANARMQQASVYSPQSLLGTYGMASSAAGNAYNAYAQGDQFNAANRQMSPLESILGIAGQAAPFFLGSGRSSSSSGYNPYMMNRPGTFGPQSWT